MLVFYVSIMYVGAQETSETDLNAVSARPAETELLFDQDNPVGNAEEGNAEPDFPGVTFSDFARIIFVLVLVVLFIYGFFWILKRFSSLRTEGEDAIRILATRPLKGYAALHLVETGRRLFLVGSTGNAVNLLTEIDDKESMDEIRLTASRTTTKMPGGFVGLFRDRLRTAPAASSDATIPNTNDPPNDPAAYIREQQERLKDL